MHDDILDAKLAGEAGARFAQQCAIKGNPDPQAAILLLLLMASSNMNFICSKYNYVDKRSRCQLPLARLVFAFRFERVSAPVATPLVFIEPSKRGTLVA